MNFGELKAQIRGECWPSGEAENLVAIHDRYFVEALYDLQKNVPCLQANNTDVYPQCSTFFQCGQTVLPAPRGHILSVYVIDKLSPYTGLEDDTQEEDWCSKVYYSPVDYCHMRRYQRMCSECSSLASSVSSFFQTLFGAFTIKRRYPTPTDVGLETQPPLQQGFHYPQDSTDASGRSPSGVFALYRGRIYIGPWIQSTETVVIEWNGIKRNWSDADLVDDDPKFLQAVRTHVLWQHEKAFGDKEAAKQLGVDLWGTPQTTGTVGLIPDLIHECNEENRKRECDEAMGLGTSGGGARGMAPTNGSGGGTGEIFYNERQSYTASCPTGQDGDSVTVVKEAGTVTSVLSVADANAQAQAAAQSEAQSRLVCEDAAITYLSTPQTATATCPAASDGIPGADGNPVTVTIPAGRYESTVSQEAADAAALAAAEAQAEALLSCTFWNEAQTYTAHCPIGTTGSDVTKTTPAAAYSSTLSQEDANAKALASAQVEAEDALSCSGDAYVIGNTPQGSPVSIVCAPIGCVPHNFTSNYIVPANTLKMTTTPARAGDDLLLLNQQAQALALSYNTQAVNQVCQQYTAGCNR